MNELIHNFRSAAIGSFKTVKIEYDSIVYYENDKEVSRIKIQDIIKISLSKLPTKLGTMLTCNLITRTGNKITLNSLMVKSIFNQFNNKASFINFLNQVKSLRPDLSVTSERSLLAFTSGVLMGIVGILLSSVSLITISQGGLTANRAGSLLLCGVSALIVSYSCLKK